MSSTSLITGLRAAAAALRSGTFYYNWQCQESCNCGVVASALLGCTAVELMARLNEEEEDGEEERTWQDIVQQHCPVTGLPQHKLLLELRKHGLQPKDICELETCSNPAVIECMKARRPKPRGWRRLFGQPAFKVRYKDEDFVAAYLTTWADLLEAEAEPTVVYRNPFLALPYRRQLDMPEQQLHAAAVLAAREARRHAERERWN